MRKIILASGSPRRKEILELLGIEFEVRESGFDEESVKCDDPEELVKELALQKVLTVARELEGQDVLVIGGDTVVSVDLGEGKREILSKAYSDKEAREIIEKLSGKEHRVMSGVALIDNSTGEEYSSVDVSKVKFIDISEDIIDKYVNSGKWRGFAGAYALQGEAAMFVEGYEGKLSTIIGMPITETVELLEKAGVVVGVDPRELEEKIKEMRIGLE